ncbi:MAG: hypothetical protein Q6358_05030 [Candidatus Brocadiales bacterium]|nr:hypothetical protein [Candidatus Brocadiales bacterium]
MDESIHKSILQSIQEIADLYQTNQAMILTEDDLKCVLVSKLNELECFSGFHKTHDETIKGTKVHCELSWFDEDGKLTIKPDITILDPSKLSILHGINFKRVPSKGFNFVGDAIVFELKFFREKDGITQKVFDEDIVRDCKKLSKLIAKLYRPPVEHIPQCYMVIFSKFSSHCEDFSKFLTENNYKHIHVIYHSGNVCLDA